MSDNPTGNSVADPHRNCAAPQGETRPGATGAGKSQRVAGRRDNVAPPHHRLASSATMIGEDQLWIHQLIQFDHLLL